MCEKSTNSAGIPIPLIAISPLADARRRWNISHLAPVDAACVAEWARGRFLAILGRRSPRVSLCRNWCACTDGRSLGRAFRMVGAEAFI